MILPSSLVAVCQTTALSLATNAPGRALLPKKLARLRASRGGFSRGHGMKPTSADTIRGPGVLEDAFPLCLFVLMS
jgi:hypothetical protein